MEFSNENSLDNKKIMEYIKNIVFEGINKYENIRQGEPLSIDRAELFIKIYVTLSELVKNRPDKSIIFEEFYRSFLPEKNYKRVEDETTITYDSKMNILRRIHGKNKITVSEIFRYNTSSSDILDYIWLRKNKLLYRGRDGKLVINKKIYSKQLDNEAMRSLELKDIYKYLDEIPSILWSRILTSNFLGRIDNNDLLGFLSKFYGYSPKVNRRLLNELRRRLANGWDPSWFEWKKISRIIEDKSLRIEKYMGPYSLQWNTPKKLNVRKIVDDLENMPLKERWKIISRIYKNKNLLNILKNLDPISLSSIGSLNRVSDLKDKVLLGKSLANIITYMITGDESYLNYSIYFAEKINPDSLEPNLRPIYRSIISGDKKKLLYYLGIIMPINSVEFITAKIWDIMSSNTGINREQLSRAIRIGYEILKYTASLSGTTLSKRKKISSIRGRMDVRKTVFNYSRFNYNIVKRDKDREFRVFTLIDISGSMIKHSLWAVLSLASIMPIVKNIILFSDKVFVNKPPGSLNRGLIVNYLEKLFIEGFKGYTNISLALRTVKKFSRSNDYILLFSDLEQTVADTEPWIIAEKLISKNKVNLVVFTPPYHNIEAANMMERAGCIVVRTKSINDIFKWFKRGLNFKIQSKLIHVRGLK
ncbi:vWA domain-containing protein [Staphylothermus hellenicus]|uniref:VWA containing CoxE family protein n=1 Tax=Staphylothermus hellenicus (strain DSM 12710 / JCM 10830 / BK20S6-10-b1 / P8) TaxID=591019 RepID=D7D9T3_STAHD|nr:vWA domain-containing protein [Staphylothermus hellenicus]ADI32529.1 hypothetical protein Shell_1441 [Staphylothermus hellenicus DSM 12710]